MEAKISRLIEDSRLECQPEKQNEVMDRCLQMATDTNLERKEIGLLLLARVLEKCSPECLRAAQSRLGKRISDVAGVPTLPGAIFLRQLLTRNPQTGDLHASIVEKYILLLLDEAVRSDCSHLKEVAADVFAIRYGCSKSNLLIATLDGLLRKKFIAVEDRDGLLNIACLGMNRYAVPLTKYLLFMLSNSFQYSRQGESLDRDKFLTVMELGINSEEVREITFSVLENFCCVAKKVALPMIPMISSMLVSQLTNPSPALFSALRQISSQYGASSILYKHFYVIFDVMSHPLEEQAYGDQAAKLLSSILSSSAFLIQPEILVFVQQSICRQYSLNPGSLLYRKLLKSLLFNTHPLVPPPVQVARTILQRHADNEISSICDLICKPRVINLDTTRVLEKVALLKMKDDSMVIPTVDEMKLVDDGYQKELKKIMEEVQQAKSISTTTTTVVVEETTVEPVQIESQKRQNSETLPPSAVKRVKRVQPETILHEGEQSVDDILDTFIL